MAELHVEWATGLREVYEVPRAGTVVCVGDSLLSFVVVELGMPVVFGGKQRPWLRVRVHGPEMPSLVLLTAKRSAEKLLFK